MSDIFFVSDTHFNHSRIILYSARPYANAQEMDEALITNWNSIVKPNDEVFHLGDFAFAKYPRIKEILARLHGFKHLILGNHDQTIIQNSQSLTDDKDFESIQNYLQINVAKQLIIMSHYGMRVWDKSHHGSIHIYGHSHGTLPPHGKSVDVGIDCKEITDEYRPISLDELLLYMSKRTFECVDHHGA